jgi:hypothetical protein
VYRDCGETACTFVLRKIREKEVLEKRVRELEYRHEEWVVEAEEEMKKLCWEADVARWRLREVVERVRGVVGEGRV